VKNTVLARRYSKALFAVAKEENTVTEYAGKLSDLAEVYLSEPAVRDGLVNPMYPMEVRSKVMAYLAEEASASPILTNFLKLLVQKKRADIIADIAEAYQDMVDEDQNVCKGKVMSAIALDDALQEKVKATLEKITGKTVILSTEIDPSILGGIVAQVGDLVLDGSLKTQLNELKESITGRN
jgi:F-type H+-transporting ATPase subunit delta